MNKLEEALEIICVLGFPRQQQNLRSCLTLLSLAALTPETPWSNTTRPLLRIVDMMQWMELHFDKKYAPNSRETIRRQSIHQFEQARLIDRNPDDPKRPTNSGDTVYQLTEQAADLLRCYGGSLFQGKCDAFISEQGSLSKLYQRSRNLLKVPVRLPNDLRVELSPGVHNELQRLIIEEFAPRFAPGASVIYIGDTARKQLIREFATLGKLNVPDLEHAKHPDVVLYDSVKNWLFLIEAVTSHGPVSPKRHAELEKILEHSQVGRVYVTAFQDFSTFKKYVADIAWESEVWIADCPDHLIHFNGQRFLGPY